jgi:transcriptional regulator with XRE-family HTH domain
MQDPGQKMRRVRERLRMRYRDVESASQHIASQYGNNEFLIGLSRLSDIENRGTVPSIFKLYSLCAIYGLEFTTALGWYGIDLEQLPVDAAHFAHDQTRTFDLPVSDRTLIDVPLEIDDEIDLRVTSYFSRYIKRWGKVSITLLNSLDLRRHRYAFIGTDDWSMYPILPPGSFVQIDESKKRVAREGWTNEYERPIYFLEHRSGFQCGWCSYSGGFLLVQPHSASHEVPCIYNYPGEAEIIGQVVGVAMRLDLAKRRHTHS